jgi:hypothetical protein
VHRPAGGAGGGGSNLGLILGLVLGLGGGLLLLGLLALLAATRGLGRLAQRPWRRGGGFAKFEEGSAAAAATSDRAGGPWAPFPVPPLVRRHSACWAAAAGLDGCWRRWASPRLSSLWRLLRPCPCPPPLPCTPLAARSATRAAACRLMHTPGHAAVLLI